MSSGIEEPHSRSLTGIPFAVRFVESISTKFGFSLLLTVTGLLCATEPVYIRFQWSVSIGAPEFFTTRTVSSRQNSRLSPTLKTDSEIILMTLSSSGGWLLFDSMT